MGCHKAIAQAIRDKRAGCCLQLKDNPPKVRDEVVSYFASEIGDSLLATDETYLQTVDGDHGRIEVRRHWLSTDRRCRGTTLTRGRIFGPLAGSSPSAPSVTRPASTVATS